MKKRGKILCAAACLLLLGAVLFLYVELFNTRSSFNELKRQRYQFSGENNVLIRVHFIGCACGLDYPQYHVDSVLQSESEEYGHAYFVNKEISLAFKDSKTEEKLTNTGCEAGCYYLELNGNIANNQLGMHELSVDSGKVVKYSCCL